MGLYMEKNNQQEEMTRDRMQRLPQRLSLPSSCTLNDKSMHRLCEIILKFKTSHGMYKLVYCIKTC